MPDLPAIEHLIMHELVHLHFIIEARKTGTNQLFISTPSQKADFIKSMDHSIKKLRQTGTSEESIFSYCSFILEALNLQIYNIPIDLFIKNLLYTKYPLLRPYQFVSLYKQVNIGIEAVTNKRTIELTNKDILSKSKILNLLNALQLKDLFGIDLIKDFRATPFELNVAGKMYEEFLQYKDDKKPGEEYEFLQNWSEDLKMDKYFELVDEKKYRDGQKAVDSILDEIEIDPFDINEVNPKEVREMTRFKAAQEKAGTNMALVVYMIDALKYFDGMPKEQIQNIAVEIAMQGAQGYNPDKKGYKLNTVSGMEFSGYKILAWYYVSWMIISPESIPELQLPYEKEYKLALHMHKPKA